MIFRLCKGLIGGALIAVACFTFAQAFRERGEARRLFRTGGTQEVFLGAQKMTLNARFLAVMMFSVPSALLVGGIFVCISVIRPHDDNNAA